ncbi:MAG: hypothetical protein PWQ42_94 [Sulfurospirillum sp.]|jgi:hypothetical protein|nr:hypothetical protein [Sulfurospirillum sp.]
MGSFDFGVSLAFWLTIFSTLLCVYYGAVNWNKGSAEKEKNVEHWAQEEDKIDEEL